MNSLPIDEQVDTYLVSLLTNYYGDLLKVSRTRGIQMNLPQLRKYISENPYILETYETNINDEIEGQGLSTNSVLITLQQAQLKAFREADYKNNTLYSSEIKKIITEGKVEKDDEGNVVTNVVITNRKDMVEKVLKDPLNVDISEITNEDATEVRRLLNDNFELFALWTFEIQMGFKFQRQDFHSIIFQVCQDVVDGKRDRVIVTIPPRHSKTQIFSISLPLFSFCHNAGSHNIITSYADDVVSESSGYVRTVMLSDLFMKIYPHLRIDSSKRSLERWGTTKGGVLHAVPTGGKLTG